MSRGETQCTAPQPKQRALRSTASRMRTRSRTRGREPGAGADVACRCTSGRSRCAWVIECKYLEVQLSSYRATSGDGCGRELWSGERGLSALQEQRLNSGFQLQPRPSEPAPSTPFPALAVVKLPWPKLHDGMGSALGRFRLSPGSPVQSKAARGPLFDAVLPPSPQPEWPVHWQVSVFARGPASFVH